MKPWIVDTGAFDHMTGDAAILQNYKPSNGHSSVHMLMDLKSGKMIGSAELCSGLYLLHMWPILKPSLSSKLRTVSEYVRVFQFCVKF
ncbi:hypothetical protein CK203_009300 [Vitis vinifera]|uniref:Uncharacterized protein n=1 Tax=Vitis vinifera TaxID=29760 RepID=A0A438K2W3_VITVI|nr:hypothetical protein CK203_009300 [Vitis vinifera]